MHRLLALPALLLVGFLVVKISASRTSEEYPHDFIKYYIMSWRLAHHQPVYKPIKTDPQLEERLGWDYEIDRRAADPPPLAVATYPFSFFTFPVAWWLLTISSLGMIAVSTWHTMRACGYSAADSFAISALALGTFPALVLLLLGHIEALLLPLAVYGWIALKKNHWLGGILWGAAVALKLFPGMWMLALLGLKRKTPFLVAASTCGILLAVSALVLGLDQVHVFVREVIPQSNMWTVSAGNFSWQSICILTTGELIGKSLYAATFVGVILYLIATCRTYDRAFVLGTCASLLLSPLAWSYYFILLIPVVILLSKYLDLSVAKDRLQIILIALFTLLWPSLLGGYMNQKFLTDWPLVNYVPLFGLIYLSALAAIKIKSQETPCGNAYLAAWRGRSPKRLGHA
jgi:hypothetical protein